jgi:excisionase family DNA binding protein
MESFVTAAEVARYLSLSPRTVAKMAREGRLPAHRISGSERKTWRFKLSEVEAYLASNSPAPIMARRPDCAAESE